MKFILAVLLAMASSMALADQHKEDKSSANSNLVEGHTKDHQHTVGKGVDHAHEMEHHNPNFKNQSKPKKKK
jgi:hypothetical protein